MDDGDNIIKKLIKGRRMEINNVDIGKIYKIEGFFDNNGNQNPLNFAVSLFTSSRGYTYHYMVCILSWQRDGNSADIQIDCGFFDK